MRLLQCGNCDHETYWDEMQWTRTWGARILRRACEMRFWRGLPVVLTDIPSHEARKRISSVVQRSFVNHQNSFLVW